MFLNRLKNILNGEEKRKIILLNLLTIISTIAELIGIGLIIPVLSIILSPEKISELPIINNLEYNEALTISILAFLIVFLLKNIFLAFFSFLKIRYIDQISVNLGKRVLTTCIKQPYTFFLNKNTAEIITYVKTETSLCSAIILNFINLLIEGLVVLGVLVVIVYLEPQISIFIATILIFFSYSIYILSRKKILFWGQKRQDYAIASQQSLTQSLTSIKETKLLGKEMNFINLFENDYKKEFFFNGNAKILTQMPRLIIEMIAILFFCSLIFYLTILNKTQQELLTIIGFSAIASFRIMPSIGRMIVSAQQLKFCLPSLDKVINILKLETNILNVDNNKIFNKNLSFKNVEYIYPGSSKKIFSNFNFSFDKGKCIGIVGKSGSGKTTLVNLILGLLSPTKGKIVIDDIGYLDNHNSWQYGQIGYVPQNIYMTDDSLKKNIAFGVVENDIDEESLIKSINQAQLVDFVKNLPEGLDTKIGEMGARISGGEKQRIAIARALYFKPEILVLDEPTSSLDENTELEFIKVIDELKKNKTIIIVSHKFSLIKSCDMVYLIESGKIINKGKPSEILK